MTDKMKLTDRWVERQRPDKADQVYWDSEVRGFGIRFRADRKPTWILQYAIGSQQRRKTLGQFPAMKAADARKMADQLRARVTLKEDVVLTMKAEVAKANERKRGDKTFGVAIREYLEWKKTRHRKNGRVGLSPRWQFQVEKHLTAAAKSLHKLPLAEITQTHVADCVTAYRKNGPSAGNHLQGSIAAFYKWAIGQGKATANPAATLARDEQSSRDRVLTPPELRIIWQALPNDHFGAIVRLLLLTGQRRSEIGDLRWSEIHDQQIILPKSRTKNHRSHIVPLSDQAWSIVKEQPRRIGTVDGLRDLIFGVGDGPFTGWSKAKKRLDEIIAEKLHKPLAAWTLHDLRRSVASYMTGDLPKELTAKLSDKDRQLSKGLGIPPYTVEDVLNHVSGYKAGVAGVYQRNVDEKAKREALEKWAQRLQEIVETKNVASLRGVA
jgi:integrase